MHPTTSTAYFFFLAGAFFGFAAPLVLQQAMV
jgi:hypothetical protein